MSVSAAIRLLREAKFTCPGPLDPTTGLPTTGHLFRVGAWQHQVKQRRLDKSYSAAKRILHDIDRSSELAALLDDSKNIPEETRLGRLMSEVFVEHVNQPSDLLDVTVAYLRRVHFVDYFSGMRFIDEGHLLSRMSNITIRSVPTSSFSGDSKGGISNRSGIRNSIVVTNDGTNKYRGGCDNNDNNNDDNDDDNNHVNLDDDNEDGRRDGYWRRRGSAVSEDSDHGIEPQQQQQEEEEEEGNREKESCVGALQTNGGETTADSGSLAQTIVVDAESKVSVSQKLSAWRKAVAEDYIRPLIITASDR